MQPTILAVGTSGPWCTVALQHGGMLRLRDEHAGNAHSQRLLPMAAELLAEAAIGFRDLDLVAFDAGPGSFTGLRIGCGVAQGVALGAGCPVVPVGSLAALAWPFAGRPVFAAIDARMGQCYHAALPAPGHPAMAERRAASGGLAGWLAEPALADPAVLGAQLERFAALIGAAPGWVAVGDAFLRYPALAGRARALGAEVVDDAHPRADALVALAALARDAGQAVMADEAAPRYVRDKVALDVDEQAASRLAAAAGP